MKVERFTAENSALLLIDHQVGTMKLIKNIDREQAAKQSIALAKMARILNLAVVITSSQEERAQGPILPEIAQVLPEAYAARVKRPGVVNAWAYPDFRNAVLSTGRKNLIMAGVTTDVCLIFPAIDAAIEGFNDSDDNIEAVAAFMQRLGLFEINILPFHRLGDTKWTQLGREYAFRDRTGTPEDRLFHIQDIFLARHIACYVGSDTPF